MQDIIPVHTNGKFILTLLLAVLFIPFAHGQPVLVLQADFTAGKAVITSLAVVDGKPTPSSAAGTYHISLLSKDNRVLYATYTSMEKDVFLRLPYSPETARISVSKGNADLITHPLSFCNSDGMCSQDENHLTCPSDCSMEQKDSLCLPYTDSVCDPDCEDSEDADCVTLPPPTLPERPLTAHPAVILVLVALLGIFLLYYIRLERRRQQPPQQYASYKNNYQYPYARK